MTNLVNLYMNRNKTSSFIPDSTMFKTTFICITYNTRTRYLTRELLVRIIKWVSVVESCKVLNK